MKSIQLFSAGLLVCILLGAGCTQVAREETAGEPQEIGSDIEAKEMVNKALDGAFVIDPSANKVTWTGYGIGKEHYGSVRISASDIIFVMGEVATGTLTVDMSSIETQDIQNAEMAANLDAHLKSHDFFSVDTHPEATLTLEALVWQGEDAYEAKGALTIKGTSHEITFPVTLTPQGTGYGLSGTVTVDRTRYDVRFGSDKFFDNLGDATIKDAFDLTFDLTLSPEGTDAIGEDEVEMISDLIEESEASHEDAE